MGEDELVDLIMLSGYQLQRKVGSVNENSIPWTKYVYFVSKDLELDITRCWYLLGCYTVSEHANQRFVLNMIGRTFETDLPDTNKLITLSQKVPQLYKKILEAGKKRLDVFKGNTVELRRRIYANEVPTPFSPLYRNNLEFSIEIDSYANMMKINNNGATRFSRMVFDIHSALITSGIEELCLQAATEHTTLMESMVIRKASSTKKPEGFDRTWGEEFRVLCEVYKDRIWKYPASYIATKTLEGPGADSFARTMRSQMAMARTYLYSDLPNIEARLLEEGMLATMEEVEESIPKVKLSVETREEIKDLFYQYMKP